MGPDGEDVSGGYYEAGGSFLKLGLVEAFLVSSARIPSHLHVHRSACASAITSGTCRVITICGGSASAFVEALSAGWLLSVQVTMLGWSIDSFPEGFTKSGDLANALNATKWGADYLVAAHSAPNQFVAGAWFLLASSCLHSCQPLRSVSVSCQTIQP